MFKSRGTCWTSRSTCLPVRRSERPAPRPTSVCPSSTWRWAWGMTSTRGSLLWRWADSQPISRLPANQQALIDLLYRSVVSLKLPFDLITFGSSSLTNCFTNIYICGYRCIIQIRLHMIVLAFSDETMSQSVNHFMDTELTTALLITVSCKAFVCISVCFLNLKSKVMTPCWEWTFHDFVMLYWTNSCFFKKPKYFINLQMSFGRKPG